MDTGIYSIKWFLQCFLDRIPFSLTLRVWDVFLLEGDSIISAMAYNILKLHQKSLVKMDMDQLMEFLQKSLPTDFGYEDDVSMECLKDCLAELKSSKLISGGPLPESELPQRKFGHFDPDDYEIEMRLEHGTRSAVTEGERAFHRNTLQREQDNIIKLRHIDSQDSLDNDDDDEEEKDEDKSLNSSVSFEGDLTDHSLENEELEPGVKKSGESGAICKTVSWKELDESLEYLLKHADLSSSPPARARPASASHLTRTVTSHQRPCSSAGPSHTGRTSRSLSRASPHSCSSSSREINISTDSQRSVSVSSHQSRPPSKTYYFGESPTLRQSPLTPELRPKPKSRYLYGADHDLQEILQNCNNHDEDEVFHDLKTPVNEPLKRLQQERRQARRVEVELEKREERKEERVPERLLTQEHNMRLLAGARTRSAIPRPVSDRHKTFSVLNSKVQADHRHRLHQVRSIILQTDPDLRYVQTGLGFQTKTHRATQDIFVAEYRQENSEKRHLKTSSQVEKLIL